MNEQSWIEQRAFLDLTLEASEGHKLHDYITTNLKSLQPVLPDMNDFKEIDPTKQIDVHTSTNTSASIGFAPSGAINHLVFTAIKDDVYATNDRYLGVFTYHTYNETDFEYMASYYGYYGNAGYDKPNVTSNAHPESRVWNTKLQGLYLSKSNPAQFLTHLTMEDDTTSIKYGAPKEIWIKISMSARQNYVTLYTLYLDFEVTWVRKRPTRLPEATMFSFHPNPPIYSNNYTTMFSKVGSGVKMGSTYIDPYNVIQNGSQYQHAADNAWMMAENTLYFVRTIILNSTNVPLMCPITRDGRTPTPFPAPLAPLSPYEIQGVAFNLHNNIWNTNYPLYYPFVEGDENFKARFTVSMEDTL